MSSRPNWDSPTPSSPASRVCPAPYGTKGGGHTRLRMRGLGSPNWIDWRKTLALCLLCASGCWPTLAGGTEVFGNPVLEGRRLRQFAVIGPGYQLLLVQKSHKLA
jgi:hypothetical protein